MTDSKREASPSGGIVRARIAALSLAIAAACVSWERPGGLAAYKRTHYAAVPQDYLGLRSLEDLEHGPRDARVVAIGDDHADRALHAQLRQLLERLLRRPRDSGAATRATSAAHRAPPILFVEFLGEQDAAAIDDYLAGRSDAATLRRRVHARWPRSWLEQQDFDGAFYRDVLALARASGARLEPLEPIPRLPLAQRDRVMAENIARALRAHPRSTGIVLVGHTHLLGEGHLCDELSARGITTLALLPKIDEADAERVQRLAGIVAIRPAFLALSQHVWWLPRAFDPTNFRPRTTAPTILR